MGPPPKAAPGQPDAGLLENLNQQAASKVELSTKNTAKAESGGGGPVPTIASLFQAKADKDASVKMTGGFVAGPDQPWSSQWVFGADKMPPLEDMKTAQNPGGKPSINLDQLKKQIMAQAQGGDESQLKQAAESTVQELDSVIQALGGQLESVQTDGPKAGSKGQMNALGGAEYLATLQGLKQAPVSAQGSSLSDEMNDGKSGQNLAEGIAAMKSSKVAGNAGSNFKVLPGGLSSESRLEGGLKLSKDQLKFTDTDSFMGATPLSNLTRNPENAAPVLPSITGHVVPGSMMRDRLSSESVRNMANSISGMGQNGGGEMRIRMNPGNLGELMIQVSTSGKNVGLKVQATDSGAKKIIEESLGALRDSLAQQSLALGRVDVTLAPTNAATADNNGSSSQNSSQQNAGFNMQAGLQDGAGQRSRNEDSSSASDGERSSGRSSAQRIAALSAQAVAGARSAAASASSRLDVIA